MWNKGKGAVQAALGKFELQKITGAAANGLPWIDEATNKLASARIIAPTDPKTAFIVGYDAARSAVTGVLAQQGRRPTQSGGHLVAQHMMQAKFPGVFDSFDTLRRLRTGMEYPMSPIDTIEQKELHKLLQQIADILSSAPKLLPAMTMFLE